MSKAERLHIWNDADRAKAAKWIGRVPRGWTLVFQPPKRTNPQNARMWAFLDDIAAQKEWCGKKRSSEDWKSLFTASLRGQEITPNLDGTGFFAFGAHTSEMSPEEMGELLTLIEAWGVQNGVVFTDQTESPSQGGDRAGEASGGASGASSPARDVSEARG